MKSAQVKEFRKKIRTFYRKNARELPWRNTTNPYYIWISELMLQQTQVDRVIPKYEEFLKRFPEVKDLAQAKLVDVLRVWQGLGYNRRAQYLRSAAKVVMGEYAGVLPETKEELEKLPGIGPYTAGAIMAFAYDMPVVCIETNIRAVFLHECFKDKKDISDTEIFSLIEKTLPKTKIREWYWGLMDYGSFLKKKYPNPSRKSKHHVTQSKFKGSLREARGYVLRELSKLPQTEDQLMGNTDMSNVQIQKALVGLERDFFIVNKKGKWKVV